MKQKKQAIIVGGGPAGLMAAEQLAQAGLKVRLCDHMPSFGRKFLMAGRGGLNITHSEPMELFATRYGPAQGRVARWLAQFSPQDMQAFCALLGEPTFVGSSGRVFPKSFKASPLLRAWLMRLRNIGVMFLPRHRFIGWRAGALIFATPQGEVMLSADVCVLAMGGGSWPKLGSDGSFVSLLQAQGLEVAPLQASNCGVERAWSAYFRDHFAGQPLKNVSLSCGGIKVRGEVMISQSGLEGGAIYALSRALRDQMQGQNYAELIFDFCPNVDENVLAVRLDRPRGKQSMANFLRKTAHLSAPSLALLREIGPLPQTGAVLAHDIKHAKLRIEGLASLARAISSVGGVALDDLNDDLMIKALPSVFVAGEMMDWDAPTGGYLLQAVMASGLVAGRGAAAFAQKWGDKST